MLMVRIGVRCDAGTHTIGVETMSHADSDGVSADPLTEYATSVGRGDAYAARAQVHVKATAEDVAVFAYPSDGRAYLNNLASLGQQAPTLTARLDSISDSPDTGRSSNVACGGVCSHTAAGTASGNVTMAVARSAAHRGRFIGVLSSAAATMICTAWGLTRWKARRLAMGAGAP